MRNFEEFDGKNPLEADSLIRCMYNNSRIQAEATVQSQVDGPTLRRFYQAMKLHLLGKECLFEVGARMTPLLQRFIVLETPADIFEKEFSWFIECLSQARVIRNPIICDLTRYHKHLK